MSEQKHNITELRSILFDTIRQLKDKDTPLDIDRAKAINETAQTIINTAKVEVDHAKVTGNINQTGFLTEKQAGTTANGYIHRIGQKHN